jgi:hypothetical protein
MYERRLCYVCIKSVCSYVDLNGEYSLVLTFVCIQLEKYICRYTGVCNVHFYFYGNVLKN